MADPGVPDHQLPDLRFVPSDSLVPHEQHDGQRLETLTRRLREQGVLKNPPVVAPFATDHSREPRYVVLDGANRATAVRAAGWPHALVQVVRYFDPKVQLSTWSHALGGLSRHDFERALAEVDCLEIRPTQRMLARALLARREALAWIAFADGAVVTLHGGHTGADRNDLLNAVVDRYNQRGRIYRVTTDSIEEARAAQPDIEALVVFPHFEPAEILELAQSGARLPAGITRHVIRGRALRLNIALDRHADPDHALVEKNRWLDEWLRERVAQRQVRFYDEPTVLFDE
jgi:hypothetical protein